MKNTSEQQELSLASLVAQVADEFTEQLDQGNHPSVEEYAKRYPQIASELRGVLPALQVVSRIPGGFGPAGPADELRPQEGGRLGDFRILREVGRGGMGVVYEARQISLNRRVALKMLPFAAVLDQKQLQRFRNEVQAAASLDHPHIVHIYSVGCERGVHYYAMQYIEGKTLAELIGELRQPSDSDAPADQPDAVSQLARDLSCGWAAIGVSKPSPDDPPAQHAPARSQPVSRSAATRCKPQAAVSTKRSPRRGEFFRSVAHLGVQAARALEHAHQIGVVHRDIKPSNLLLDVDGQLWVADFGLAMTQSEPKLTTTGDFLGTLRYMSPEQVEAKRGVLDHRTDVYSLGVTLYELLTLQPAFGENDRRKLMRQILEENPCPPRQANKSIPKDLETIVLKATAKEPKARYATAGELADDLERFLEDRPVQARRPSLLERTGKWSRRHRAIVWSAVVILLTAVVTLSVSTILITRAYQAEAAQRARANASFAMARDAVDSLLDRMEQAIKQLARRNGLREVEQLVANAVELERKLPEEVRRTPRHRARLASMHYERGWACTKSGRYRAAEGSLKAAIALYKELAAEHPGQYEPLLARCYYYLDDALREMGRFAEARDAYDSVLELITITENDVSGVVSDPQGLSRIRDERDDGGSETTEDGIARQNDLIRHRRRRLAEAYDRRGKLRLAKGDLEKAFADYDQAVRLDPQYAEVFWDRGNAHLDHGSLDRAIADLTEAIRLAPLCGYCYNQRGLAHARKGDHDQALADFTEAIRLGQTKEGIVLSPGTRVLNTGICYSNRGAGYSRNGEWDQALADLNEAIRLAPKYAMAYHNRGNVYRAMREFDRAIADFDQAIRLDPKSAVSYCSRGLVYFSKGEYDQAIAAFSQAVHVAPENPRVYGGRGNLFLKLGDYDQAIADFTQAITLAPEYIVPYNQRGRVYLTKGEYEQAVADFSRAIAVADFGEPPNPETIPAMLPPKAVAYSNRGYAYGRLNEPDKALADLNQAIRLAPEYAEAYSRRGNAWLAKKDPNRAMADYDQAVRLAPDSFATWKALGIGRYRTGDYEGAEVALGKADQLWNQVGGDPYAGDPGWLVLAMAQWQLGDREAARRWYDRAVQWMEKNRSGDYELQRLRAEAARLLGIDQTTPKENGNSTDARSRSDRHEEVP